MSKSVRACCRINEELHQELLGVAKESQLTIGVAMRRMLMLGVDTYKEKRGRTTTQDIEKTTLLRAERFAIFAITLQFIQTMDAISPAELETLERRTLKTLRDRWQFGDDPYLDALMSADREETAS